MCYGADQEYMYWVFVSVAHFVSLDGLCGKGGNPTRLRRGRSSESLVRLTHTVTASISLLLLAGVRRSSQERSWNVSIAEVNASFPPCWSGSSFDALPAASEARDPSCRRKRDSSSDVILERSGRVKGELPWTS